ncbi:hypothetical protein GCM10010269_24340 [Streptomyces humidus]|uniref:Uncharacterized protein n=1 Tax=Streptomyces humidus TaxID=52259 RepID=A0A918FU55_9ACTN|nr:hypothetical protein GCM10010269_24340 [Streptomyces humidus]
MHAVSVHAVSVPAVCVPAVSVHAFRVHAFRVHAFRVHEARPFRTAAPGSGPSTAGHRPPGTPEVVPAPARM